MWIVDKILRYRILSILFAVVLTLGIGQFMGALKHNH